MSQELKDKVAFITGASLGIGLATARELADAGARVAMIARDKKRVKEAARTVEGSLAIECDVTDVSAVEEAMASMAIRIRSNRR